MLLQILRLKVSPSRFKSGPRYDVTLGKWFTMGMRSSVSQTFVSNVLVTLARLIALPILVNSCLTEFEAAPVPLISRVRGVRVEQIRAQVDREKYIAISSLQGVASLSSSINSSYLVFDSK